MIRIVITLVLVLLSLLVSAQTSLEKGMQKAFALMQESKDDEAANLLERMVANETENWLPAYHLALLKARTSFSMKDKEKQAAQIAAAEDYVATADALSPNNSEVYVVKAMVNLAKIVADPITNGPTLSAPTEALYKKALELDNTNPRAHSGLIEFQMGSARFFGQDLSPYCERLKKTIALYDAFKPETDLHPNWGKEWVLGVIKGCDPDFGNTQEGTTVEAKVTNVLRDGGDVIFALYGSEADFNSSKALKTLKVKGIKGTVGVTFENLVPGTYAIVVLHDLNGNDQMDFEPNGMPKEHYGASNNVMRMGPPTFEDAKFTVGNKSVALEIRF